jgi:hypothetical protein
MQPDDHGQYIDPRLLDAGHADAVPIPAAHVPHAPYHAPKPGPTPIDLDGWSPREERRDSDLDMFGPFELG